ncbi:MAG: DUF1566 domain-containing protein [Gammaproteobacteria bacterium]|jgi:hypothetical protein|nr:DUF1566 domain-containing protein [Gammaproteobacteria bacterium]MBT4081108.1 DUF1566 domain-containing protein [Gammaproteobacteria bacterium]MBT5361146.1 DUF1566 domain-containing protein [Gammaproteobacteria bacterium]MBT6670137.1 DUF1566 domain-containing protein [Gammaproteobacteria bacterium]
MTPGVPTSLCTLHTANHNWVIGILEQARYHLRILVRGPRAGKLAWFWSSSPNANNSNNAWKFSFNNGNDNNNNRNNNNHVRLVRGGK